MKNQPTSAMIAGIMSGVAAACVCLTIVLVLQNRSLQSQLSDARRLCSDAVAYTSDLRVQQASTVADLSSHRQRLAELQQEVSTLESKVTSNVAVSSRPVPVRIFDGNRLVGLGWIPASATNRSGMAGEGIATVFLDRRNPGAPPSEAPAATQTVPTTPAAAAASSAFVIQQSPYFGWLWPYGGWGWDPEPDGEPVADPQPQPGLPPAQEAQANFLPTHTLRAQTMPSGQPRFSAPAARPTPLPPRLPTVASVPSRATGPARAGARNFAPAIANRAASTFVRQPVPSAPTRR